LELRESHCGSAADGGVAIASVAATRAIAVHGKWCERDVRRRRRTASSPRSRTQHHPHSSKLQLLIHRPVRSTPRTRLVVTPLACSSALVRDAGAP
jgi:hypothetical protein